MIRMVIADLWLQLQPKLVMVKSRYPFETGAKIFLRLGPSIHERNRWNCGNFWKNYVTVWTARNFHCVKYFEQKRFLRTGPSEPAWDDPWEFRFYLTHPLFIVHGTVKKILLGTTIRPLLMRGIIIARRPCMLLPLCFDTTLNLCSYFKVFRKIRVSVRLYTAWKQDLF